MREQDEARKWTIPAAATGGPKPTSFSRGTESGDYLVVRVIQS